MDDHYHGWFGLRLFWPLIIGIFLIIIGLSALLGINIWQYLWPIIAILIGLLIILRVLLGYRRRY
jgi:uncharacterized membrane protein